jgi:sirohydrochlorin ferrochelatase
MNRPVILLTDNGSARADSVLNLRRLARRLSERSHYPVSPVSLQHADKIPAKALDGDRADTLHPFLRQKLAQGAKDFLLIPLFFGVSRALTNFIPQQVERLKAEYGSFNLTLGEVLYPLPQGEPRLAKILVKQMKEASAGEPLQQIVVVDHGSPLPQVSEVRKRIAEDMRHLFISNVPIAEAAMERRVGRTYDFNGELLEHRLVQIAQSDPEMTVDLALLFLSPGRHAGPGGDIEQICQRVNRSHPRLKIRIAPLLGQQDILIDILQDRLISALKVLPSPLVQ